MRNCFLRFGFLFHLFLVCHIPVILWCKPPVTEHLTFSYPPRQGRRIFNGGWFQLTYKRPMPSTHLSLHYHLIFATKNHDPIIVPSWRPQLHAYMGGVIRTLGGSPQIVGGVADHVHLLVGLKATHCLADVMRELKGVSSKWVHEEMKVAAFSWQEGYGAFTLSASHLEGVTNYVRRQEQHHRKKPF